MLRAASLTLLVLLPLTLGCPGGTGGDPDGAGPELLTEALPAGEVGAPYHATLQAHGGTGPRVFSVPSVPPGFSFYPATGILEGTPRQAGSFSLTFSVTDAGGRSDSRSFSLVIRPEQPDGGDEAPDAGEDPPVEEDAYLEVANWNVEWFGSDENGPGDEQRQLEGAAEVIHTHGAAVWALVEVTDASHFHALVSRLETITGAAWEGVVANDPSVISGASSYGFGEQKPALLWKSGTLSAVQADVILSGYDYAFAGRPPLRIQARLHTGDTSSHITFVVLHLKANDAASSHQRRENAADALQNWLQMQSEGSEILVLGDWNDDLDVSISTPLDTPFRQLLQTPGLTFLTQRLTELGISTTTRSRGEPIDHQLATRCLTERYVTDSVWVEKTWPTDYHFPSEVSDHYPVTSRFRFNAEWQPCG